MTDTHLRHSLDGYPLCWPMDKDGTFIGTFIENEVTCPQCLNILEEYTDAKVELQPQLTLAT